MSNAISGSSREGDIGVGVALLAVGGREPLRVEPVGLREGLLVAVEGKAEHDDVGVGRDDVAVDLNFLTL